MPRLFLFGIGGTGSRVIRSLTFLLASGVDAGNWEIVPILIDPDGDGGDLNRTKDLLNRYGQLNKPVQQISAVTAGNNRHEFRHFFATPVKPISNIGENADESNDNTNFKLEIDGVQNERFQEFIDYNQMSETNRALTELLFSRENLEADLKVGFKGNPNIGSVVLNSIAQSAVFRRFAAAIGDGDRVFIISSIFGGTGAAGFPLLVKNIRNGMIGSANYEFMKTAPLGAVTILPYFRVTENEESAIDSKSFISKTQAALGYYAKNLTGNNSLNALYYLGDQVTGEYENTEGGRQQMNKAHFVEIAAALSVIDFLHTDKNQLQVENGKAISPVYKEFGINHDHEPVLFGSLAGNTQQVMQRPLTAFYYFSMFIKYMQDTPKAISHPYANGYDHKIDKNFMSSAFFGDLKNFAAAYQIWLGELSENRTSFKPFAMNPVLKKEGGEVTAIKQDSDKLFAWVIGVQERKTILERMPGLRPDNYEYYIAQLNDAAGKLKNMPNAEARFIKLFSDATSAMITNKLFQL
jgi:hypothetical protein